MQHLIEIIKEKNITIIALQKEVERLRKELANSYNKRTEELYTKDKVYAIKAVCKEEIESLKKEIEQLKATKITLNDLEDAISEAYIAGKDSEGLETTVRMILSRHKNNKE